MAAVMLVLVMATSIMPIAETDAEESGTGFVGESRTYDVPSGTNLKAFILDTIWDEHNWKKFHNETNNKNYTQLVMTDLTLVLEAGGTYYITSNYEGMDSEQANQMADFSGDSFTIVGNGATVVVDNGTSLASGRHDSNYIPTTNEAVRSVDLLINDVNFIGSEEGSVAFSFINFPNVTLRDCNFSGLWVTFGVDKVAEPSVTLQGCSFERQGIVDDFFAVYFNYIKDVSMDDCDITDSPRGINFRPRVDDASLSVTNSHFQDMIGAAVQMGESNAGETVALNLRGNTFERCEYGVYVHEFAQGDGSVVSTSNSYTDCSSDFYYGSGDDGSASEFVISSNGDRFEKNGYTTSAPTIGSESSSAPAVDVTDPVMDAVRPPVIWDDDDDYVPPIVPAQPSDTGDDNTVTVVACAAAAVVAALMAAFLILDRKR